MSSRWVYQDSTECRACNDLLSDFAGVQSLRDEIFGSDSVLGNYVDQEHEDTTRIQNFRTFMGPDVQELCCRCREQTGQTHPLDTFCASCTTGCDYSEVNNIDFDAFADGPEVTYDDLNNVDDGNSDDPEVTYDDLNNVDDGNSDDDEDIITLLLIVAAILCVIGICVCFCCCKKS
jgi:hypothetical protein